MSSSDIAHHKARVASFTRSRTPDDPELVDAKRSLAEANIRACVEKVLAAAPPLNDEQRTRLVELLRPPRQSDRTAVVAERLAELEGGVA